MYKIISNLNTVLPRPLSQWYYTVLRQVDLNHYSLSHTVFTITVYCIFTISSSAATKLFEFQTFNSPEIQSCSGDLLCSVAIGALAWPSAKSLSCLLIRGKKMLMQSI